MKLLPTNLAGLLILTSSIYGGPPPSPIEEVDSLSLLAHDTLSQMVSPWSDTQNGIRCRVKYPRTIASGTEFYLYAEVCSDVVPSTVEIPTVRREQLSNTIAFLEVEGSTGELSSSCCSVMLEDGALSAYDSSGTGTFGTAGLILGFFYNSCSLRPLMNEITLADPGIREAQKVTRHAHLKLQYPSDSGSDCDAIYSQEFELGVSPRLVQREPTVVLVPARLTISDACELTVAKIETVEVELIVQNMVHKVIWCGAFEASGTRRDTIDFVDEIVPRFLRRHHLRGEVLNHSDSVATFEIWEAQAPNHPREVVGGRCSRKAFAYVLRQIWTSEELTQLSTCGFTIKR